MIDDVLGRPDQLRDALWRIESARLEAAPSAGLFVCGMGGSAIGGDLAAAALGDRLTGPMATVRGYALPSWATPGWTVLCSSYSGGTEETLACFEAASTVVAPRVGASLGRWLAGAAAAPPHRRPNRRRAGRQGAGDGVSGGRLAEHLPAARRRRLRFRGR